MTKGADKETMQVVAKVLKKFPGSKIVKSEVRPQRKQDRES